MFLKKILPLIIGISFVSAHAFETKASAAANGTIQSIYVVNLLANTSLGPNTGMTATPVKVDFYNSGQAQPCFSVMLQYQDDYLFHAGDGSACTVAVTQVIVTPQPVAQVLRPYAAPSPIKVDPSFYSTAMNITQTPNMTPLFDTNSGLVKTPGAVTVILNQSQLSQ